MTTFFTPHQAQTLAEFAKRYHVFTYKRNDGRHRASVDIGDEVIIGSGDTELEALHNLRTELTQKGDHP